MLEPVWSTCRSKSAQDCFQLCHLFLGSWYGPAYISFPPENGCCLQQRLQEIKAADGGLTDCILCLCSRRWGSAVADLNLCPCLCCPATQPFPLLGACGRAPGRLWVLSTGESWGCIRGRGGGESWEDGRKEQTGWAYPPHAYAPAFPKRFWLFMVFFPASSTHPFLPSAFPCLHPQPLHLLQISLTSPNLSYPFHLPREKQSVSQILWSLPSSPLYPPPTPECGLNFAYIAGQPQHCLSPWKPVAYTQPLLTPNLLTLPTSQLFLLIFTSFDSCRLFTVSSSCSRCPQTWSVTSTKWNLANISGKPLISSGNRNNSVNLRLAKDPSAVGSSIAHLASVLQQHPGFGWGYGLVMRFLTFFPA